MLTGIITRNRSGSITIEVDGYDKETFIFYLLREAKQRYRQKHNLQRKHIQWYEFADLLKGLM